MARSETVAGPVISTLITCREWLGSGLNRGTALGSGHALGLGAKDLEGQIECSQGTAFLRPVLLPFLTWVAATMLRARAAMQETFFPLVGAVSGAQLLVSSSASCQCLLSLLFLFILPYLSFLWGKSPSKVLTPQRQGREP